MKAVIANTAALNTGDAAILIATMEILRQSFPGSLDMVAYDQQAETTTRYYPAIPFKAALYDQVDDVSTPRTRKLNLVRTFVAALLWRSPFHVFAQWFAPLPLRPGLDEFADAAFVVSAGGTYLVPHYRIFPKLFDLLIAIALRRPLILFTQSLGPFPKRRMNLLHFVLARSRLILVRDELSKRHLLDFGIRAKCIGQCADAAFALARPYRPVNRIVGDRNRLRIAISVRNWPHISPNPSESMDRYLDAIASMTAWLLERHDADIVFLSTCQGIAEYWTDDATVADAVVARLPDSLRARPRVCHQFHDPAALIDRLASFDVVVSTRMHVAILALCAGIPVLPIAYEFKTVELFRRLGFGELILEMGTVTGSDLCRVVGHLLTDAPDFGEKIAPTIERERESAFQAGRLIRNAVGAHP